MMNKMLLLAALFAGVVLASAQTPANTQGIQNTLCGVIAAVQTVVGVVAILLFVLGGIMYAIAHMMPSSGQLRGNLQGWSMGMIVGGIVGLILVLLAPGLVSFIISSAAAGGGAVSTPTCIGGFGGI